ncbi:MAG: hypothetical protein HKN15_07755, partial [Xanthomonadales bacterium]|nr:hypothetical protein [Xanthomonadales bacterium]
LMPLATPLPYLVIGLSFGLVFGGHVFGGTGRYFVSPALLGVVFLAFSWPAAMNGSWLPGMDTVSTWEQVVSAGHAVLVASGTGWLELAAGQQVSATGVGAAGACLVVAAFLVFAGLIPWRIIVGGMAAICVAGVGFAEPPWYWQAVLGSFCFALVFIATDPTTVPESRIGCWALGIAFGSLTIVIRMLNPAHPEGTLYALLLALLLTPLIDHFAGSISQSSKPATNE